ncbi:MAG: hypothetical protein AAGI11_01660 [Pseudomonadota bacterium]
MLRYLHAVLWVMLVVSFPAAAGGPASMPQRHFACQVDTVSGIAGLVLIQADDREEAENAALKAEAHTLAGTKSQARALMECIEQRGERFRDSYFDRFYREFPR